MSAVAQQHDRLGGDSLQDYLVFNRVTRVACAGHVSDDRAKAILSQRLLMEEMLNGRKVTKPSLMAVVGPICQQPTPSW